MAASSAPRRCGAVAASRMGTPSGGVYSPGGRQRFDRSPGGPCFPACAQVAAWQAVGIWRPPLVVAVNLSAASFIDQNLVEQLLACTRHHGVAPASLLLEVTGNRPDGKLRPRHVALIELRAGSVFPSTISARATRRSTISSAFRGSDQDRPQFRQRHHQRRPGCGHRYRHRHPGQQIRPGTGGRGNGNPGPGGKLRDLGVVAKAGYFARLMPAEQLEESARIRR